MDTYTQMQQQQSNTGLYDDSDASTFGDIFAIIAVAIGIIVVFFKKKGLGVVIDFLKNKGDSNGQ